MGKQVVKKIQSAVSRRGKSIKKPSNASKNASQGFDLYKTKFHSWLSGALIKGEEMAINGEKMVIFGTGVCTVQNCYSCPATSQKWQKDFTYANEMRVMKKQDLIDEAKLSKAQGAGITGGDLLLKIDRVSTYIEMLKQEFGPEFHVHLYTPLKHVTNLKLERLEDAGLDEIRLLPDINEREDWQKINLAKKFKWGVSVELVAVPGTEEQMKKLIDYITGKVEFLNIHELEMYDDNAAHLPQRDILSIAVDGSQETGLAMMKYAASKKLNVHFSSSRLKDAVQLKNRIKRRAENVATAYDVITDQGTLFRGVIYIDDAIPDIGYRHKLEIAHKRPVIKKLFKIKRQLQRSFNIPFNLMDVDEAKLRITTSPEIVNEFKIGLKKLKLKPAIVEEYPTYDGMEVDIEFL